MTKLIIALFICTLLFSCSSAVEEEGATPFVGDWKLDLSSSGSRFTEANNPSPLLMRITALGSNGLRIAYPKSGTSCDGTFDGREGECQGPGVPEGFTMSLKLTSPNELSYSAGSGDRITGTLTVSEDGLTLTQASQPEGFEEPVKAVYQKQSQ